jgi:hypothetical protein
MPSKKWQCSWIVGIYSAMKDMIFHARIPTSHPVLILIYNYTALMVSVPVSYSSTLFIPCWLQLHPRQNVTEEQVSSASHSTDPPTYPRHHDLSLRSSRHFCCFIPRVLLHDERLGRPIQFSAVNCDLYRYRICIRDQGSTCCHHGQCLQSVSVVFCEG